MLTLSVLIIGSSWAVPWIQDRLDAKFSTADDVQLLRSMLLTLGGAFIGAAAIVSSLVLFAMQINIERLPHGLFRRLSGDWRLLCAYMGTFVLAVMIGGLSLSPPNKFGAAIYLVFWATIIIILLFLFCYRRALVLVNPISQLGSVLDRAVGSLRMWDRRAERLAPFALNYQNHPSKSEPDPIEAFDHGRYLVFQTNTSWTSDALQGVRYAISFARRYAEQGDIEVSAVALSTLVEINHVYVKTKGRTFFSNDVLSLGDQATDTFINTTLENLRQLAGEGRARGDEQQIEQVFRALVGLVRVYLRIEYTAQGMSKYHAHLAAGYLSGEVERAVPSILPDVVIAGIHQLGICANHFLIEEGPDQIVRLVQKIGTISCAGAVREEYWPVVPMGVGQLGQLSFNILRIRSQSVSYGAKEIRNSVARVAKAIMAKPDTPLDGRHSTCLAPYYSVTSNEALLFRLTQLTNGILNARKDNKDTEVFINNIGEWAEGIDETTRDILQEAIIRKSSIIYDLIHWITKLTILLSAISNSDACRDRVKTKIRIHALQLFDVLYCIPDHRETIVLIENMQFTQELLLTAEEARRREFFELFSNSLNMLVHWMFMGGKHQTGWGVLERSVYAVATLVLLDGRSEIESSCKERIRKRIAENELPINSERIRAANAIRERANSLWDNGHWLSAIDAAMKNVDQIDLKRLLLEIADLLSPDRR